MHRPLEPRTTRGTVEFRAAKPGKKMPGMKGYALKYNRLSRNLGGFVEQVLPGAFDKSLADGADVLARYNHDDNYLLGRTTSGTLSLRSDATGLLYVVEELPDTSAGRDMAVLLERGDVQHSSFAFFKVEDDWGTTEQGFPLRSLVSAGLADVAPVNTPAYIDTSSAVRSLASHLGRDVEDIQPLMERGELVRLLTKGSVVDLAPAPVEQPPAEQPATPEPAVQQATTDDSATAEEKSADAQGDTHAANDLRARRLALMARRTL